MPYAFCLYIAGFLFVLYFYFKYLYILFILYKISRI